MLLRVVSPVLSDLFLNPHLNLDTSSIGHLNSDIASIDFRISRLAEFYTNRLQTAREALIVFPETVYLRNNTFVLPKRPSARPF